MRRPRQKKAQPAYRLHAASGQAIVTIKGHDHYLGAFNSVESRGKYGHIIIRNMLDTAPPPTPACNGGPTVCELVVAYLRDCPEVHIRLGGYFAVAALLPFCELCGGQKASGIGPLKIKEFRKWLALQPARTGLNRGGPRGSRTINQLVQAVVRMLRWGAANELIPSSAYEAASVIRSVRPHQAASVGMTAPRIIKPVSDRDIELVIAHVPKTVAAIIRMQRCTGMRAGEVLSMRATDIDMSKSVWVYSPPHHKTAHLGKRRLIYLLPDAQKIIRPYLTLKPTDLIFGRRQGIDLREVSADTKDRQQCRVFACIVKHNGDRNKSAKELGIALGTLQRWLREFQERGLTPPPFLGTTGHTYESYTGYIRYAWIAAGGNAACPRWHCHQLRHAFATEARERYGMEIASALLGHTSLESTEHYAQVNKETVINQILAG